MLLFDEYGHQWKYRGGDPCARLVNRLVRMNYRMVVLPFITLATGKVTEPAQQPEDIIQRTRMADCLEALT